MIAVITVDIDDDLGTKTNITGPVVGVENCKIAGYQLLLNDPEDPDGNTIFKAIQVYNELEEENKILAILTGDSRLGYQSYKKINNSLDILKEKYGIDRVILVTDGLSDESEILPLLSSRNIKVIQVIRLSIKQSSRIENTYMFIINKLKDPYYSKLIFGIPGLALFILSTMLYLNINLSIILFSLGLVLLFYGFNFPQILIKLLDLDKINKYSLLIIGLISILISMTIVVAYYTYVDLIKIGEDKIYSFFKALELVIYPVLLSLAIIYLINIFITSDQLKIIRNIKSLVVLLGLGFEFFLVNNFITGSFIFMSFDVLVFYSISSSILIALALSYLQNIKIIKIYLKNPINYKVVDIKSNNTIGYIKKLEQEGVIVETEFKETIFLSYDDVFKIGKDIVYVK